MSLNDSKAQEIISIDPPAGWYEFDATNLFKKAAEGYKMRDFFKENVDNIQKPVVQLVGYKPDTKKGQYGASIKLALTTNPFPDFESFRTNMIQSQQFMTSLIDDFSVLTPIKDTLIADRQALIARYRGTISTIENEKRPFISTLIIIPTSTEAYQIALSQSALDDYGEVFNQAIKSITFKPSETAEELLIKQREQESADKEYSQLGEVVGEFDFRVKTDDLENYEDGYIPWADIKDPEAYMPKLENKDEVIVNYPQINVIIDYPVSNEYVFILKSTKGFTRSQLLHEICKQYQLMYKEEEDSATIKTIPPDKRTTIYNRNETNGKYGIWGHDIEDLALSKITVYKNGNGDIIVIPYIES